MKPNWFIGLPIDGQAWLDGLVANAPEGIRAFADSDLHLTVAFLGGCGRTRAAAAFDALRAQSHPSIDVSFGPIKAMGNPRRPSAYSLTLVHGRDETAALMTAWRTVACDAAGVQVDARAALPHITIARPPRRASHAVRQQGLSWMESLAAPPGSHTLKRLALYTWATDRSTALFRIVEQRPLDDDATG